MTRATPVRFLLAIAVAVAVAAPAAAQAPSIHYPEPAASSFTVTRDVQYASADTLRLRLDVYRPTGTGGRTARPALVFFTAPSQRANPGYMAWARIAASKGLVAVLADLRGVSNDAAREDFRTLLAHLVDRGAAYGIDTAAIAAFGASSNSTALMVFAQDPTERRLKAAVHYYASDTSVRQFRRDLPVLLVRTGLDRPFVNQNIDTVAARALAQNAPFTIVNHPAGHHGFEFTDDDVITRELIDQTVDFVRRTTAPPYRAAIAAGVGVATAAAHVMAGNFAGAAAAYADLLARAPDDAPLRLAYGVALLGDRQFARACDEFARLRGKGLGPRDLGLPAASACLQKGDPDAAVAWLASIPRRFLPARVKDDPTFAALRERADFRALFEP